MLVGWLIAACLVIGWMIVLGMMLWKKHSIKTAVIAILAVLSNCVILTVPYHSKPKEWCKFIINKLNIDEKFSREFGLK